MNTPIFGKAYTKQTGDKTQQELGKLKDLLEEDLKRLRPGQDNAKNKQPISKRSYQMACSCGNPQSESASD